MRPRSHRLDADIPTSSMADITFLLVVFFLLASTLVAARGLDLALPRDEPTLEVDPVDSIHLRVDASGRLQLDGRDVDRGGLLVALRAKLIANPDKPVILDLDGDAPYGLMVQLFDDLRRGREVLGLEREIQIALLTARERDLYWQ